MTPRATDWSLAFLVALLFTTGLLSLVSGRASDAWVVVLHGIGGFGLAAVVVLKLRRVWRRLLLLHRWDPRDLAGILGTLAVLLTLRRRSVCRRFQPAQLAYRAGCIPHAHHRVPRASAGEAAATT